MQLVDEDLPCPPPRMPITRQIYFRELRSGLNESANIFHDVKADICNLSRPEPAQNGSSLECDRQFSQCCSRKSCNGSQICWNERIEHGFFFAPDLRSAPDGLAHITAELVFDIRENAVTNLVP